MTDLGLTVLRRLRQTLGLDPAVSEASSLYQQAVWSDVASPFLQKIPDLTTAVGSIERTVPIEDFGKAQGNGGACWRAALKSDTPHRVLARSKM